MKLRAPRCRDSMFLMSVSACNSAISPSSASAVPAEKSPKAIRAAALSMFRNPFRHRLHAVDFRVPGHKNEECKINGGAEARQNRINARRRFHAADRQADERHGKQRQHHLIYRTLVAYRLHRRA